MSTQYFFYIVSKGQNKLQIGITDDLIKEIYELKNNFKSQFKKDFKNKLLYYKFFNEYDNANNMKKKIRGLSLFMKFVLIHKENPKRKDLSSKWFQKDNLDDYPFD